MGSIILIIAIVQTYIIGFHLKEYAYDNEGSIMFFVYLAGIVFFIIKAYSYFTFLI